MTGVRQAVAIGHVTLDGGANDEHIEASRAEYNIRTQLEIRERCSQTGASIGVRRVALTND